MDFRDKTPSPPPPYTEREDIDETEPLLRHRHGTEHRRRPKRPMIRAALLPTCLMLFITVIIILSQTFHSSRPPPIRIAVIGAGPAGISASVLLSKLSSSSKVVVNITIFEEKHGVGGRMLMSEQFGSGLGSEIRAEHVAGGNLMSNRRLWKSLVEMRCMIQKEWDIRVKVQSVGFFNGARMLSEATRPISETSWGLWLGQILSYGSSVWRAKKLPVGTMKRFDNLQYQEGPYHSVAGMLLASEIGDVVGLSAAERLRANGISQRYVDEVIAPQVKRQTGQQVSDLSDLALSMALEREHQGLLAGQLAPRIFTVLQDIVTKHQMAVRLNTRVTALERQAFEAGIDKWMIEYQTKAEGEDELGNEMFDEVILAAPWNATSLQSEMDGVDFDMPVQYQSQWVTFLKTKSNLDSAQFGGSSPLPSQILPVASAQLPEVMRGVQEISHLEGMANLDNAEIHTQSLFRILSDHQIPKSTLSLWFNSTDEDISSNFHQEKIENAYPLLYVRNGEFPEFKVAQGLWHTAAIESIGSSMDLSWVAGENVARLLWQEIEQKWKRH